MINSRAFNVVFFLMFLGWIITHNVFAQPSTSAKVELAKKSPATQSTGGNLGLITGDDVPIYISPTAEEPGKELLFRNMVVKILKDPPGSKRIEVECEAGRGWIDSGQVNRSFDRVDVKRTYETQLGMAWFFQRFNHGTNYETMSFETETFSTDEYRALIEGAQKETNEESSAAQVVIARTLMDRLKKPRAQWDSRDRYLAQAIQNKDFWLRIQSNFREFWAAMPENYRADRELLLKTIPKGAYLIYDLFSAKMKDDPEVAKATFKFNPEALRHASSAVKDNEDIVLIAALVNPLVIEHGSARLRDNEELFKKIAPTNAFALQFASDRLKKKADFIIHVCTFRPWAIQYASEEILDNESVFLAIATKNPMVVRLASKRLRTSGAFMKKMYQSSPSNYKNIFYNAAPAEMRHQIDSP